MRIFKCLACNSEVLCDNDRPIPEEAGMYQVKGKYIEIGEEDFGLAANVDEDADEGATAEGTESKRQKVVDIVHNNRLQETTFTKATYLAYIKGYMKNLMDKIKAADEEYAKTFAANAQAFVKKVVGSFDEWQFYYPDMGDEADYEQAIVILCKWQDEQTPIFYFFKDGLKAEKV